MMMLKTNQPELAPETFHRDNHGTWIKIVVLFVRSDRFQRTAGEILQLYDNIRVWQVAS